MDLMVRTFEDYCVEHLIIIFFLSYFSFFTISVLHLTAPVQAAPVAVAPSSSDRDREPKEEPRKETKRSELAEPKERAVAGGRDSTGDSWRLLLIGQSGPAYSYMMLESCTITLLCWRLFLPQMLITDAICLLMHSNETH